MRFRVLEHGWLTAVLCALVVWAATSLNLFTLGGASSAWAANGNPLAPNKDGKSIGEKMAVEQRPEAPDPADQNNKLAGPKDAAKKDTAPGADKKDDAAKKDDAEKDSDDKNPGKNEGDAKAEPTDKPAEKKAPDEKAVDAKLVDKTLDSVDEKTIDDKFTSEKGASEKIGSGDSLGGKESFLTWLYRSLGTRYVVIFLIITFNAVALIVMIVLGLRRNVICPEELAASFEAKLNAKQYQDAYELAKKSRSFLGKVLAAGMSRLSDGYDESVRAMQEVGEEQNMKLEQRNGYIALIAQIGPMFGLLGTVDGMVMAFDAIAHSNVTPKPSELAQGIGTALVTTVVGLWIAIPLIAFYQIVRNRLTRLVLEVGGVSGDLMKRFASVQTSAKKGGPAER